MPSTHCAVTQGGIGTAGTPGQPTTVQGSGTTAAGMAATLTSGLGTVGSACPPCAHITVAPCWIRKPGIVR